MVSKMFFLNSPWGATPTWSDLVAVSCGVWSDLLPGKGNPEQKRPLIWVCELSQMLHGTGLGGGFKDFLFSPLFGEDSMKIPILTNIFQRGGNHQPVEYLPT